MSEFVNPTELDLIAPTSVSLNKPAEHVLLEEVSSSIVQGTIDRMLELASGKGRGKADTRQMVGLAAVQLGVNLRICIIDTTADGSNKDQNLEAFINPTITSRSYDLELGREGCWSCGNICGAVERAESITLDALDRNGKPSVLKLSGFVARIAQHEVDHLDGIRFPDRIPPNHPERLHIVKPTEFERYRTEWNEWDILCPRTLWDAMKTGRDL